MIFFSDIKYQDNQFKFLSNTYVKTKYLSEKPNECFVNITKGKVIIRLSIMIENKTIDDQKKNIWIRRDV